MATEPLDGYLVSRKIEFEPPHTSLWRGYIGTWKIDANKLYLIKLNSKFENVPSTIPCDAPMEYLFPGQKEVFAEWFTG